MFQASGGTGGLEAPLLRGAAGDDGDPSSHKGSPSRHQGSLSFASAMGSPDVEQGGGGGTSTGAYQPLTKKSTSHCGLQSWLRRHSAVVGYFQELFSLAVFFWTIVADCLFLTELYRHGYTKFATAATVFVASPHVVMSMLLVLRQGWVSAAGQSCTFIAALNPLESINPIPGGCFGVLTVALAYIVYTVIAVSGLLFVMYCLFCYLVIALIFSLLILDLAMLVVAVVPSKRIFKYTDLVYLENFKFSRLVVQVVLAHSLNVADKVSMFMEATRTAGSGVGWHMLYTLAIKGGWKVSPPVLEQNLDNMLRGTHMLHIASQQPEEEHEDEDNAPSVVPEYLTPSNGSWLSPGQTMQLLRHAFAHFAGPGISELVLEVCPELCLAAALQAGDGRFPHLATLTLAGAHLGGRGAARLPRVLAHFKMLTKIQLYESTIDAQGANALADVVECSYCLSHLEICKCRMPAKGVCHLASSLKSNLSLCHLSLAYNNMAPNMTEKFVDMLTHNKSLRHLNLAHNRFNQATVQQLMASLHSNDTLQQLVIAFPDLGLDLTKALVDFMQGLVPTFPQGPRDSNNRAPARPGAAPPPSPQQGPHAPAGGALFFEDPAPSLLRGPTSDLIAEQRSGGSAGGGGGGGSDPRGGGDAHVLVPPGVRRNGSIMLGPMDSSSGGGASSATPAAKPPPGPQAAGAPALALQCQVAVGRVPIAGLPQVELLCLAEEDGLLHEAWDLPALCAPPTPHAGEPSTSTCAEEQAPHHRGVLAPQPPQQPQQPQPQPVRATLLEGGTASASRSAPPDARGGVEQGGATWHKALPTLTLVVPQEQVEPVLMKAPLFISNLHSLDVSDLDVGDEGAKTISQVLEQGPCLACLRLAGNGIGDAGVGHLTAALRMNTRLSRLDLSANALGDEGALDLAAALRENRALREVVLTDNQYPFSLETLRTLLRAIRDNKGVHVTLAEEAAPRSSGSRDGGDGDAAGGGARPHRDDDTDSSVSGVSLGSGAAPTSPRQGPHHGGAPHSEHAHGRGASGDDGDAGSGGPGSDASGASRDRAASGASCGRSGGSGDDLCGICFDNPTVVAIKRCGHPICVSCYREVCHLRPSSALCPFCRSVIAGYTYLRWPPLE